MSPDKFWTCIQEAHIDLRHPEELAERFSCALSSLSSGQIEVFSLFYDRCFAQASHWDLYAAAHLFKPNCDDLDFTHFRSCLILCGQDIFQSACMNADSLARLIPSRWCPHPKKTEALFYSTYPDVIQEVYLHHTGRDLPDTSNIHIVDLPGKALSSDPNKTELRERCPMLYAALNE